MENQNKYGMEYIENGAIIHHYVWQSGDNEVENLADTLREIRDDIHPGGRYDKDRIHVVVEPGDKHPDFKGCPRCGNYMDFDMESE